MEPRKQQTISSYIHPSAEVSPKSTIGSGTKVWHLAQIRENSSIGSNCTIGKNIYIDFEIEIGDNCKIQNNSSIYHGSQIGNGVFIGPHCCLTNDKCPRAITADGQAKTADDWEVGKILIQDGASLGAGTIVLPNVTIGRFAMIGSGSVVSRDIPDHALAYGNPARIHGYVCHCGLKLDQNFFCAKCQKKITIKQAFNSEKCST